MSFICDICSKSFVRRGDLNRHLRQHDPDRHVQCPWLGCDHRTSQRCNLDGHINRKHLQVKPYICGIDGCSREFADRSDRCRHQRRVHLEEPIADPVTADPSRGLQISIDSGSKHHLRPTSMPPQGASCTLQKIEMCYLAGPIDTLSLPTTGTVSAPDRSFGYYPNVTSGNAAGYDNAMAATAEYCDSGSSTGMAASNHLLNTRMWREPVGYTPKPDVWRAQDLEFSLSPSANSRIGTHNLNSLPHGIAYAPTSTFCSLDPVAQPMLHATMNPPYICPTVVDSVQESFAGSCADLSGQFHSPIYGLPPQQEAPLFGTLQQPGWYYSGQNVVGSSIPEHEPPWMMTQDHSAPFARVMPSYEGLKVNDNMPCTSHLGSTLIMGTEGVDHCNL